MKLAKDKVSFKIRLAAFQASGGADTWHLNTETQNFVTWHHIEGIHQTQPKILSHTNKPKHVDTLFIFIIL